MFRFLVVTILFITSVASSTVIVAEQNATAPAKLIQLPHTDGYALPEKPQSLSPQQNKQLYQRGLKACDEQCVTPFGKVLGTANGAVAYSNCKSTCIKPEYSFLNLTTSEVTVHKSDPKDSNLHYIGVIYQCVEYARKWWMLNKGITFGSIDSAYEIIYLEQGKHIHNKQSFPLARSINGSAKRPPKVGDLLIYSADRDNPQWRHGHVAVVVDVNLAAGSVSLAEENYNNLPWEQAKKYARKIRLFEVSGLYTVIDVATDAHSNNSGANISGWIYPLAEQ